jgi:sec-independent protein translocase protein TatB
VFGLGFGEMVVLGIVLLVVVGPRELPSLLRSVGRGVTKLRRMSRDLRDQSGIDDIIADEGLGEDIRALRSLSRGNVVDSFVRDAMNAPSNGRPSPQLGAASDEEEEGLVPPEGEPPPRDKEYPSTGCDSYGATEAIEAALPTEPEPSTADDDDANQDGGDATDEEETA